MEIKNIKIYGIEESIKASKYPMATNTEICSDKITSTVSKLASAKIGSGHDNFLNGIVVQFDLTFSLKAWTELQRYHFLDFVSSQSTIHRITKFDINSQCNKYVTQEALNVLNKLIENYNLDKNKENMLAVLYNIPSGFELTARMTTNYRQLKTIYWQRKNHVLPEWREFCKWIESLPYFNIIIEIK